MIIVTPKIALNGWHPVSLSVGGSANHLEQKVDFLCCNPHTRYLLDPLLAVYCFYRRLSVCLFMHRIVQNFTGGSSWNLVN